MKKERSFSYLYELIAVDAFTIAPTIACPYPGMWGFNPSVLRTTEGRWLVSIRCANYCMPGGVGVMAQNRRIANKTILLDYGERRPTSQIKPWVSDVRELDGLTRMWPACTGFEDLRLVQVGSDVCAVATAMQLNDRGKQEIVLVRLAEQRGEWSIVEANPLRGDWSSEHQKNWTPYVDPTFAHSVSLLYSIERGGIYHATMSECWSARYPHAPTTPMEPPDPPPGFGAAPPHGHPQQSPHYSRPRTHHQHLGVDVQLRGSAPRMGAPAAGTVRADRFPLRGGSQLVRIDDTNDLWLGIAHGMRLVGTFKFYWHVFYAMTSDGVMVARSQPFKLAEAGIEFCAGLAIDPANNTDTIVLSYGTEDMHASLATCALADVCALLVPVDAPAASITPRRSTGVKESY